MRFLSIILILLNTNCSQQVEEPNRQNLTTVKYSQIPFPESKGRKLNGEILKKLAQANIVSKFVKIEPGVFEMGSPKNEAGRDKDEILHKVEITEPYFMAKFETTIQDWFFVQTVIKKLGREMILNIPSNIGKIIAVIVQQGQHNFIKKFPSEVSTELQSIAANKELDHISNVRTIRNLLDSWKTASMGFRNKVTSDFGKKNNVKINHEYITDALEGLLARYRNLPINNVSYSQVVAYCHAKTQMAQNAGFLPPGMVYRLPTEAEWEYACRAGKVGYSGLGDGQELNGLNANLDGSKPGFIIGKSTALINRKKLIPVSREYTRFSPNQWGLYDMHGSVMEWCYDYYAEYVDEKFNPSIDKRINPIGTFAGKKRVLRGGSFLRTAYDCRAANRESVDPSWRGSEIGFRVVLGFPLR